MLFIHLMSETLNRVMLLRKPTLGNDRAIGLIVWLVRLWCAIRRDLTRQWTADRAGVGDQAIAGSSALQVAAARLFLYETTAEGLANGSILWDLDAFYDSCGPILVLEASCWRC